ncbi:hypothetical protein DEQ92_20805 [Haloferax sp. Atlit-6N]|uniref:hypothetical protein n=1 Tax=Haloferacaceae TaxID=1644056 RepID=UPI000E27F351|nr:MULTISPECIES: hypothetical protein [Haloferacaceae]RDZ99789.1 hypothetical protein DEQ92_20805 [Haloferax sp. Atlit-6N]RLM83700.1 hypothetical protein D3D02_17000 [Halobellus sp. Atlit-38R]
MPSKKATLVVGLALAAAVGVIGLSVAAPVVNSSTGTVSQTNETVTASTGDVESLRGYNIDAASVVVYGYNDTSGSYETTTEYTLYEDPGDIEFDIQNSTLIDDGEDVKVTYDYQATSGITSLVAGYLPLGIALMVLVTVASRVEELM